MSFENLLRLIDYLIYGDVYIDFEKKLLVYFCV